MPAITSSDVEAPGPQFLGVPYTATTRQHSIESAGTSNLLRDGRTYVSEDRDAVYSEIAADWLKRFGSALEAIDVQASMHLLLPGVWWRDLLAMTWDLRTFQGAEKVEGMLSERLSEARVSALRLSAEAPVECVDVEPGKSCIQAYFDFATSVGAGRGVVRLVREEESSEWKGWTVMTALRELTGFEEHGAGNRPESHVHRGASNAGSGERRSTEREAPDREPSVVILGSGQGGLSLAARLGQLGVDTLVIEKNRRVGDNWRKRYDSLVLHDPTWVNHLPYLPFPEVFPAFLSKDELADWLEAYVGIMELNVWTDSELVESTYDDLSGSWRLVLRHDGEERVLHPRHLVFATGALGRPRVPEFEGTDEFQGVLRHSSEHGSAAQFAGQKAIVVGACNSGHDIAQDFYENGADVTLVQRSSTYVMTAKNGIPVLYEGVFADDRRPTDDSDLLAASTPWLLTIELAKQQTKVIAEKDRELLDGLTRAGFKVDDGVDGGGLLSKALQRAGGYYIDVGCSSLIAEGKVKVKQGSGIKRFTESGVEFDDGEFLEADVVVLATGYANMRETARDLLGDEVADRCSPVWGLDSEGELRTIWRQSGQPGLWFMGGSLQLARSYSLYLALQIKAIEEGLISSSEAMLAFGAD
jgi:cation diffusion facilitator CzcD-associated flavoprotein CzcO